MMIDCEISQRCGFRKHQRSRARRFPSEAAQRPFLVNLSRRRGTHQRASQGEAGLSISPKRRGLFSFRAVLIARTVVLTYLVLDADVEPLVIRHPRRSGSGAQARISEATLYNWKAKYGGMDVSEAKRLRMLEDENPS